MFVLAAFLLLWSTYLLYTALQQDERVSFIVLSSLSVLAVIAGAYILA